MQDAQTQDDIDDRLLNLAKSLLKKRDEAIEHRAASGIERQWREDQRAFEGLDSAQGKTDMLDFATGEAWIGDRSKNQTQKRSRVIVNVIRSKCETAEGRFSEIQLPTDDKNWGLAPTPVQDEEESAQPMTAAIPGQIMQAQTAPQMSPEQMMQARDDEAKKRCGAMEKEIADQLEECDFNGECRKAIRSAVRLGTGVLKGPDIIKSTRSAWMEQRDATGIAHILKIIEKMAPASKSRDIWNIYPDPHCEGDAKRGSFIWERDHVLPRELRSLIGVDGYIRSQILKVLAEDPIRTTVALDKGNNQRKQAMAVMRGSPYERWEYHGDIDKDDLIAMGCDCPEDSGETLSACVVFANDRPIKARLNMLDNGELPYDFFKWVEIEDSPWGIGEPRKMIWQQRIITAAWRQMMDNAGDSSGAMIVIGKDTVPENGVWEVTGKSIWVDESEDGDVNKAFAQYQIQNNQEQLERIIELALKFIDMETGTPMIAQGEKGSAPETLGGLEMLMGAADTTRRRQVKEWDDKITRPHIGRYYHWNMMYNQKNSIKGDFNVDARGTSVLLVRDQTAQNLLQVMQLRADPEVNIQVDWGKVIKQLFQARHLDVLKSDADVDAARQQMAQNPQPPLPVMVEQMKGQNALQLQQAKSQAELQQIQQEAANEQRALQSGGTTPHVAQAMSRIEQERIRAATAENVEASRAQAELARAQKEQEIAWQNGQQKTEQMQLQKDIALLEYANREKINLDTVKAQLAKSAMDNKTKQQLARAEIQLAQVEGDKDRAVDLHKHHTSLIRDEISTPNTP